MVQGATVPGADDTVIDPQTVADQRHGFLVVLAFSISCIYGNIFRMHHVTSWVNFLANNISLLLVVFAMVRFMPAVLSAGCDNAIAVGSCQHPFCHIITPKAIEKKPHNHSYGFLLLRYAESLIDIGW